MEDPLTGDVPAAFAREEEEEAARDLATTYSDPPAVQWASELDERTAGDQLHLGLLVFVASPTAAALLQPVYERSQVAGMITLQQPGEPQPKGIESIMRLTSREVLLIDCTQMVPPERAVAWTRAVLKHTVAEQIVVLTQLQAADYHGPRAAEDTSLQFSMRTAAAKGMQQHPNPVSYLPSGTLISGLSAAVMSYCQARSRPATMLIDVQLEPSPDTGSLHAFAQAAEQLLQRAGWRDADLLASDKKQLAAVCRALDRVHRSQPRSALFV